VEGVPRFFCQSHKGFAVSRPRPQAREQVSMLRTIFSQSGIGLGKDEKRFSRGQPSPPQRARSSRLRIWALESAWSVAGRPGLPATSWQRVFNRHFRTASSSRLHATTPGTPASSSPSPAVPPRKPDLGPMAAIFRLFGGMATLGWLIFGMAVGRIKACRSGALGSSQLQISSHPPILH
jgi:hypothetical protein